MSLLIIIPSVTAATIYIIRKLREWQWGWVRNGKINSTINVLSQQRTVDKYFQIV